MIMKSNDLSTQPFNFGPLSSFPSPPGSNINACNTFVRIRRAETNLLVNEKESPIIFHVFSSVSHPSGWQRSTIEQIKAHRISPSRHHRTHYFHLLTLPMINWFVAFDWYKQPRGTTGKIYLLFPPFHQPLPEAQNTDMQNWISSIV